VVIDHRFCDIGSANFTPLSHGVYDEINLYVDNPPFARAGEAEIESHCAHSRLAESRLSYRKMYSGFERAIMAYQSRRGG
jgi:phosphatidylserine/phosphatidylglycerophosphate/cardiolipin synthase-like enzyme